MPAGEPDVHAGRGARGGRGGVGRGLPGRGRGIDAAGAGGRGSPPIANMTLLRPGSRPSSDLDPRRGDLANQQRGGGGDGRVPSRGRGKPPASTGGADQGGSRDAGGVQFQPLRRDESPASGGRASQQAPQQGPRLILGAKSLQDASGAGGGARSEGSSRPGQGPAVVPTAPSRVRFLPSCQGRTSLLVAHGVLTVREIAANAGYYFTERTN
jgi:hypothetical protein